MPVGVVPHYKSCLLVWCLTVGHVFWCFASLYAMPVGVVLHYRPSLLVRFALQPTFWLVECRPKGIATSLVLVLQKCNYIRHVCWPGATLRYACLYSATLSDMHAGFIYSDTHVCKDANPQIHQTCLQVRCGSHGFVKLISYHPGRHLEYIKFWVMH